MSSDVEFEEFVLARSPALLRTAYLLVRDLQLAEDLLQTALTKAWFAWNRVNGDPEPYVRRILVTTSVSWWRQRWTHETPTAAIPDPAMPDGSEWPATATRCGTRSAGCRAASVPWSSCGSSRTAPKPGLPTCWGARSAP